VDHVIAIFRNRVDFSLMRRLNFRSAVCYTSTP